jgi:hypothetical protein
MQSKNSVMAMPATLARPQHCLESFHYMKQRMIDDITEHKLKIFLDSGAFSMMTQNVKVDLKEYARFVYRHQNIIETASNLDAIGTLGATKAQSEATAQQSYDNLKTLEGWLKPEGLAIQPVHHVRDADHWLQRYIDEGYDYIFLGGMVPESTQLLRVWLDHVWHNYLTNDDGTPKVKVHGFGLTTLELMFRYPWYSVDSTSWAMTSMFGSCIIDFPQPDGTTRDFKIDFSTKSKKQQNIDSWHWECLDKLTQDKISARLEELEAARVKTPAVEDELEKITGYKQGYNAKALGESYGWRDNFNIYYFERAQDRHVKTFKQLQPALFT